MKKKSIEALNLANIFFLKMEREIFFEFFEKVPFLALSGGFGWFGSRPNRTLWELMQNADDEGVRLRAAKAVLDSLRGFHAESPTVETTTQTRVERTRRVIERA